ncbi:MAG TPA: DUF2092 domain-containing protein [Gemmatimonadaceae bacterium]
MSMRKIAGLVLIGAACRNNDSTHQAADSALSNDHTVAGSETTTGTTTEASYAAATETIDASAIAALNRMGTYLRSLKAYEVKATTTQDDVLSTGQKAQFTGTQDVLIRQPNGLRAELTSEGQHRFMFYDGKNFTLYADGPGYYATVPVPSNLRALGDTLQKKFGIEMPLRDLFLWGTDAASSKAIRSAVDLGPTEVDGTTVQHYAFRQDGVDWQVWIQNGDYPLPRKLVITTTDDDARPDYSAVLDWNLAPSYNTEAFVFYPPSSAKRIAIRRADSAAVN